MIYLLTTKNNKVLIDYVYTNMNQFYESYAKDNYIVKGYTDGEILNNGYCIISYNIVIIDIKHVNITSRNTPIIKMYLHIIRTHNIEKLLK